MTPAPETKISVTPRSEALELAAALIPKTWLDPMLTGKNAVIGAPPYGCPDVERLLAAIRERILSARVPARNPAARPEAIARRLRKAEVGA